jgi:hypothetical protein
MCNSYYVENWGKSGGALRSVDDVAFAVVAFVQQTPEKALG